MPIFHKEEFLIFSLLHRIFSTRNYCIPTSMYPLTMRSIRGGTLGRNIEIYSTPTNQFDWSVSRAYVINIFVPRHVICNLCDWSA